MKKILETVLEHKREEIRNARQRVPLKSLIRLAEKSPKPKKFVQALKKNRSPIRVIAEIKRSSPKRMFRPLGFDPKQIAEQYQRSGAAAISVLTDCRFFGGSPSFIPLIRNSVSVPLLRKEFILDEYQVYESRLLGADAVLLMACNFFSPNLVRYTLGKGLKGKGGRMADGVKKLRDLMALANDLSLTPLMEVHNRAELDRVLSLVPELIGINNRDLNSGSLKVDLQTTEKLLPLIPDNVFLVSESGFQTRKDLQKFGKLGVDGFLIGSSLMEQKDPGKKLRSLIRG